MTLLRSSPHCVGSSLNSRSCTLVPTFNNGLIHGRRRPQLLRACKEPICTSTPMAPLMGRLQPGLFMCVPTPLMGSSIWVGAAIACPHRLRPRYFWAPAAQVRFRLSSRPSSGLSAGASNSQPFSSLRSSRTVHQPSASPQARKAELVRTLLCSDVAVLCTSFKHSDVHKTF